MTALDVNLELKTPPPQCPNNTLLFTCEANGSDLIRWENIAFGHIIFRGNETTEGKTTSVYNSRAIAKLTKRMNGSDGLFNLASSLTIYPPLLDFNHTNLNQSDIKCIGDHTPDKITKTITLLLLGEEFSLCMII